MTTEHSKQLAKLPCAQKNVTGQSHIWQKRIPKPLPTQTAKTSDVSLMASHTTQIMTSTTAPPSSTPPYDYKAELDKLSTKIKIKLQKHFDSLYVQI